MAYRVHATLSDDYCYPEWYAYDNSGYAIICSDYVIRENFLMLKDAEIILKDDIRELEVFYIALTHLQDFSVTSEVVEQ